MSETLPDSGGYVSSDIKSQFQDVMYGLMR
jgi:hypothetical protein